MDKKLKLVLTLIVVIALLALFFWATKTISSLTGHSITASAAISGEIIGGAEYPEVDSDFDDDLGSEDGT
tara:strand:- start:284 stop:493 length:210 start_codon:yes stop_codon:yes gene_type:complete